MDRGALALQGDDDQSQHQNGPDDAGKEAADSPGGSPSLEPRRFHMSRRDPMSATSQYPSSRSLSGVSKKRPGTALFIERKIKSLPSRKLEAINHGLATHGPIQARSASRTPPVSESLQTEEMEVDATGPKKYKKPGVNKSTGKAGATTAKSELPPAMLNRWNVNLDKLTADMNAFALEQIGLNIQLAEKEKPAARKPASVMSPPRFKPKAPTKRYAERHPEERTDHVDNKMSDADMAHSDTDDDDYVIETYVRVPLSAMRKQKVAPGSIGLLVFDDEPDLELFYGEGSDSEDEWAEDDEDENGKQATFKAYHDAIVDSAHSRELLHGRLSRRGSRHRRRIWPKRVLFQERQRLGSRRVRHGG